MALICASVPGAETLGDARQLSRLGEPLRLVIPVRPDAGPAVDERCLAVAGTRESDGLPHILTANVAVEREGNARSVVVTTSAPMREPVSRLVLRITCDGASRQYTLFLEPAGSTRQVRSVAQPGPQLGTPGSSQANTTSGSPALEGARAPASGSGAAPVVTFIPVLPGPTPPASAPARSTLAAEQRTTPPIKPATPPSAQQPAPSPPSGPAFTAPAVTAPEQPAAASTLEAENQTLKQQVAELSTELQRLQQAKSPEPPTRPLQMTAAPAESASASAFPRWDMVWPVLVALAGLSALTVGGFMWHRRHNAGDEWALTGPPSHRVVSRTSLAEEPVTFRQAGIRTETPGEAGEAARAETTGQPGTPSADAPPAAASAPPAALRLQPSTEDLARDLEQEPFIAERAHSALERAHPEIVDVLTRSWGTAAARQQLVKLLETGSAELARMSGEAVAELRLLLRIADDSTPPAPEPYVVPTTLTPPAPAW